MNIASLIWDRDSHGLFDYECRNVIKHSLKLTGCRNHIKSIIEIDILGRSGYEMKGLLPHVEESLEYI